MPWGQFLAILNGDFSADTTILEGLKTSIIGRDIQSMLQQFFQKTRFLTFRDNL